MGNIEYIALSRQTALFRQMDVVANNIANAATPGYKSESMMFSEYLSGLGKQKTASFTSDVRTLRNMTQGPLRTTNRSFDMAIEGKGFFEIDTPLGARYTRVGMFQRNAQGELVTAQGYRVQGESGPIALDEDDLDIFIREDGTVMASRAGGADEERGKIKVVKFENENMLREISNSLYDAGGEAPASAEEQTDFRMAQGMVEDSNVNPTRELTELIKVSRSFGMTSNFLGDINALQEKAIATLAKQPGG